MKALLLVCLLDVALGYIIESNDHVNMIMLTDKNWQSWKGQHKKEYHDIYEEKVRYAIWKDNLNFIKEFNAKNKKTKLEINHFGDLTNTEFV